MGRGLTDADSPFEFVTLMLKGFQDFSNEMGGNENGCVANVTARPPAIPRGREGAYAWNCREDGVVLCLRFSV